MSTGVPDYIIMEGSPYANALVTSERGRNQITELGAVVLRAPAANAVCLERAVTALQALSDSESPLVGLPQILHAGTGPDGGRVLVFDALPGEPAYDRLSRLDPFPEAAVLAIAQAHVRILDALAEHGYSGLRPWAREIWWDAECGDCAFLGWEWLVKGRDAVGGDVRAAAALWIELATCVPPAQDLTVDWGPETWLALPLGTRRCLYEIWQGGQWLTTHELATRLFAWSRQMSSTPTEQLAEGRRLLEADQVGEALEWLDRVRRVKSSSREARRAHDIATGRLNGYVEEILRQARKEMMGHYSDANRTLYRAIGLPNIEPQLELKVHRLQTAAQALADAAVKLAANEIGLGGQRLYDLLETPLLSALTTADTDDVEKVAQQVDECVQNWKRVTGTMIPQLKALWAEFALPGLWQQADQAACEGRFDDAFKFMAEAQEVTEHISYVHHQVLRRSLGRTAKTQKLVLEHLRRMAGAEHLAARARIFLDQGDPLGAIQLIEKSLALARNSPGNYGAYARLLQEAISAVASTSVKDNVGEPPSSGQISADPDSDAKGKRMTTLGSRLIEADPTQESMGSKREKGRSISVPDPTSVEQVCCMRASPHVTKLARQLIDKVHSGDMKATREVLARLQTAAGPKARKCFEACAKYVKDAEEIYAREYVGAVRSALQESLSELSEPDIERINAYLRVLSSLLPYDQYLNLQKQWERFLRCPGSQVSS